MAKSISFSLAHIGPTSDCGDAPLAPPLTDDDVAAADSMFGNLP
jgi:hypothetical protein